MYQSFMGGMFGGFMEDMFRHMDARKKAEKKAQAGITLVDGLEGLPRLNIPHKYYDILISDEGYFSGHIEDTMTIYDKEGKFLFEGHGVAYLGYGMFLVGLRPEKIPAGKSINEFGYALYDGDKKMTDSIFRTTGWNDCKFNKEGFAKLKTFEGWKEVVVDRSGEILVQEDSMSSRYISISGVVCSVYKGYINLLTGEMICEKKWGSSKELSTDDILFVEMDKNCIYQINKSTGEFIVHGEIPKKEEPKPAPSKYPEKPAEPKIKVPNRNDPCFCGSGKKYKHCCLNKVETK